MLPHLDAAHNLARWLVGDASLAQDVVQDAVMRAFGYYATYQGGHPRAWLLRIGRNVAYGALAARKRGGTVSLDGAGPDAGEAHPALQVADPAHDPGAALGHCEGLGQLEQALAALPAELRECVELRLLVQADVDGELSPAEAARVAVHLGQCGDCAELQEQLLALTQRFRREAPYHAAPGSLRAAVRARIAADTAVARPPCARLAWWQRRPRLHFRSAASFGGGFALAACLALLLVLPNSGNLPDIVVANHIRALQPGHMTDVASTDEHTVKPWFDGRLDFAPPVKELRAVGFPLAGGRLDYFGGRAVAALVYQRRQHIIDLFGWPDRSLIDREPATGSRNGYNFQRWSRDGMALWAVSDLGAQELAEFARLWQANLRPPLPGNAAA